MNYAIDLKPGVRGLIRSIRVVPEPGCVRAEIEDDPHHFRLALSHKGGVITAVAAEALRAPWASCPGAPAFLAARLTGLPLHAIEAHQRAHDHCTHLFDIALAAAAHAGDDAPTRFDFFVSDPVDRRMRAEMWRDGAPILAWELEGTTILAPADQAGRDLRKMKEWYADVPESDREAVRLLRRAVMVSGARRVNLDAIPSAASMPSQLGACYTFTPERVQGGARNKGSTRDFAAEGKRPLSD